MQDKQTIEELARLLGWKRFQWLPADAFDIERMIGTLPDHSARTFPPSRLDGNGMLWLMDQLEGIKGFKVDLLPHDGVCYVVTSGSDTDLDEEYARETAEKARDLPAAVNRAALAGLLYRSTTNEETDR